MELFQDTLKKQKDLRDMIRDLKKTAIAFSGGADSAYLLYEAVKSLGKENVIAITACSAAFPDNEKDEAENICKKTGVKHILFDADLMSVKEFRENSKDRCYYCKKALFKKIIETAKKNDIRIVCDGSNADDEGDYRPGLKALAELDIESPLKKAGLSKTEIRQLSKEAGLSTWNKPSLACLASRIPYGEEIDVKKLKMAGAAEKLLHDMGFVQVRVRIHGDIARIETEVNDIKRITEDKVRKAISSEFKQLGFAYISLDLDGYRCGSMNEVL